MKKNNETFFYIFDYLLEPCVERNMAIFLKFDRIIMAIENLRKIALDFSTFKFVIQSFWLYI
jgi:hypothetical protein